MSRIHATRTVLLLVALAVVAAGLPLLAGQAAQAPPAPGALASGVRNFTKVDATFACGGATTVETFPAIKAAGYKSVVNLRTTTEEGVDIDAAKKAAASAGLAYYHLPFVNTAPDATKVDDFLKIVQNPANQPLLLHCASGGRASMFWMLKRVMVDNWPTEKAMAELPDLYGHVSAPVKTFAMDYLKQHGKAVPAAAPAQAAAPAAGAQDVIRIPFESYTLPNGLTVILSQDRTTPTVAVNVWYHVGSKNEVKGRTGFAHLFEHVMFTGSKNVPYGMQDKLTEGVGGSNNGTTSNDRTTYFETVPSNYLESALWIEADRMGFLLDTLDIAKLNAQRDIVKNERRQSVDNQPYGRVDEIVAAATYPPGHPYSWDVIGSMDDLTAATETDVKNFFKLYYAPNNAFLAIAGDFDVAQAKAWVAKYFTDISRGQPVTRPNVAPATLAAEQRLVYEDRVQVPRLYVQWPTVGVKNDDQYALDVLGAILSGPRTARLTKALVYDQQAAASVSARQSSNEDVGEFNLVITPRPGKSLTDLEATADGIIDRFKAEGPTAEEIKKATAGEELSFVSGLQSNLGKAMELCDGASFHGDPGYFRTDYQKSLSVTADDVKRVANKYLTKGRVVLSVVPMGKLDQASKPGESKKVTGDAMPRPEVQR
jgi:zinc protease